LKGFDDAVAEKRKRKKRKEGERKRVHLQPPNQAVVIPKQNRGELSGAGKGWPWLAGRGGKGGRGRKEPFVADDCRRKMWEKKKKRRGGAWIEVFFLSITMGPPLRSPNLLQKSGREEREKKKKREKTG